MLQLSLSLSSYMYIYVYIYGLSVSNGYLCQSIYLALVGTQQHFAMWTFRLLWTEAKFYCNIYTLHCGYVCLKNKDGAEVYPL